MELLSLQMFPASLPLQIPLQLSSGLLLQRDVLLLKWQFRDRTCWTEASPLPGYSIDSREDCIRAWHQISGIVRTFEDVTALTRFTLQQQLPPALEYGLASIRLYDLPDRKAEICHLMTRTDQPEDKQPAVMKIKAGQCPVEEDIIRLRYLFSRFPGTRFRIDANTGWHRDELEKLLRNLDHSRIEWLEEPLKDPAAYSYWPYDSIHYALDESLYQQERIPRFYPGLGAVIIKPMLMGYHRAIDMADWARRHKCPCIFSSSFETPVGLALLHRLSAETAPDNYHGLDTGKYYASSLPDDPQDWITGEPIC